MSFKLCRVCRKMSAFVINEECSKCYKARMWKRKKNNFTKKKNSAQWKPWGTLPKKE